MAIGSFKGLYTFLDIEEIYGIDASCLRKKVARGKFVIDEDIKKIGTTWIITEQAMIKNFGVLKFEEYKEKKFREKSQMKKINSKKFKKNKKSDSMNEKEEQVSDSWSSGVVKGLELKSFSF
jgi:hypothetical protein